MTMPSAPACGPSASAPAQACPRNTLLQGLYFALQEFFGLVENEAKPQPSCKISKLVTKDLDPPPARPPADAANSPCRPSAPYGGAHQPFDPAPLLARPGYGLHGCAQRP